MTSDSATAQHVRKLFAPGSDQDETFRQGIQQCIRKHLSNEKTTGGRALEELTANFLTHDLPEDPQDAREYIEFLLEVVVPNTVNVNHPRFVGHMTSVLPSFLGPLSHLLTVLNQNVVKVETSHVLTLMERQSLAMMHRLVFRKDAEFYETRVQSRECNFGTIASCGTLANITAMWIARNKALKRSADFAGLQDEGFLNALRHYGWRDAVIVGSELMHYSMDKVGSLIGLGGKNIIKLMTGADGSVNVGAVQEVIEKCREEKRLVVALVGVAGTTETGAVDDLETLAEIASNNKIHFHVDAAWGGPVLFSENNRSVLKGIERADTVTICGHKQLYLPQGISMVLTRDPADMYHIKASARYQARAESYDLGKHSAEGSRPASSLYLHAALHMLGRKGYSHLIDEGIDKARYFAKLISSSDAFELMQTPKTNIVVYRFVPPELRSRVANQTLTAEDNYIINSVNEILQDQQYLGGRTFISRTSLVHTKHTSAMPTVVLRAVFANPTTTESDIKAVLEDQMRTADAVLTKRSMSFGDLIKLLYHQTSSLDRQ